MATVNHHFFTLIIGDRLLAFCEDCEILLCRQCVPDCQQQQHTLRNTYDKAPQVKTLLNQALSDLRIKRNVLDENRSLLGQKMSELNIKEKSLVCQIRDIKAMLLVKIENRFKVGP